MDFCFGLITISKKKNYFNQKSLSHSLENLPLAIVNSHVFRFIFVLAPFVIRSLLVLIDYLTVTGFFKRFSSSLVVQVVSPYRPIPSFFSPYGQAMG